MIDGSGARFKLPVWSILRDTFLIPARHPREFVKPLALPGLLIVVLIVGWNVVDTTVPKAVGWALYAVYGAAFTMLAVACHRLVLLGPSPETLTPRLRWGSRETRFLLWLILLAVMLVAARLVLMLVVGNALMWFFLRPVAASLGPMLGTGWIRAMDYCAFVAALYFVGRLSLVLPATAIDSKLDLRVSWQRSARNGWRLVLVVGLFPWVLSYGVDLLYRENATLAELVMLVVLSTATSAFGVVALSLSYHDLQSAERSTADEAQPGAPT